MKLKQKIEEAVAYIRSRSNVQPKIGLILGSGLGAMADTIENADKLDYGDIPHFPTSTVAGHAGKLVFGQLQGKQVVAMQGRFHFYEGYTQQELTFPVRVFKALGIEIMVVTNACGGLRDFLYPGALMLIRDHINFTGSNPLIGENDDDMGPRFPDMSSAYDRELMALARNSAENIGIKVEEGVYTAASGPYYLSKAELSMVRGFGSDTIGMSTVPEVIVAVHTGIRVLGISCVTDMAIPETMSPPTHEHVVAVANETRPKFIRLVTEIIKNIPGS
jgi:purine-nucleoside phosphorylase